MTSWLIKVMRKARSNGFVGNNTLYLALCRHKDIGKVDFIDGQWITKEARP